MSVLTNYLEENILNNVTNSLCLGTFGFGDYTILILVLMLSLILNLIKRSKSYKTNLYLLTVIAVISYMYIKNLSVNYYESAEDKFLIEVLVVLGLLLVALGLLVLGIEVLVVLGLLLLGLSIIYLLVRLIGLWGYLLLLQDEQKYKNYEILQFTTKSRYPGGITQS